MYNFLLPIFTLVGLVAANCDTGICPGSFPNKTLEQTFGDQVKTCCSGHNSYIFTDFCDVSTFKLILVLPFYINLKFDFGRAHVWVYNNTRINWSLLRFNRPLRQNLRRCLHFCPIFKTNCIYEHSFFVHFVK